MVRLNRYVIQTILLHGFDVCISMVRLNRYVIQIILLHLNNRYVIQIILLHGLMFVAWYD